MIDDDDIADLVEDFAAEGITADDLVPAVIDLAADKAEATNKAGLTAQLRCLCERFGSDELRRRFIPLSLFSDRERAYLEWLMASTGCSVEDAIAHATGKPGPQERPKMTGAASPQPANVVVLRPRAVKADDPTGLPPAA